MFVVLLYALMLRLDEPMAAADLQTVRIICQLFINTFRQLQASRSGTLPARLYETIISPLSLPPWLLVLRALL